VFALENIPKYTFLYEYVGQRLTYEEGLIREYWYDQNDAKIKENYLFLLEDRSLRKPFYIDVPVALKKYGISRFMNHSKPGNVMVRKVADSAKQIHVCFYTRKPILKNEELVFNYGEERKDVLAQEHYSWIENTKNKRVTAGYRKTLQSRNIQPIPDSELFKTEQDEADFVKMIEKDADRIQRKIDKEAKTKNTNTKKR
jgi:SET domain-containing protein